MSQPPQGPTGSPQYPPGGQYPPNQQYQQYPPYPPTPFRPQLSPSDAQTWAVLAHLSAFAGGFVGFPLLGPLVVYLVYKDRSAYTRRHAAAALNFQILALIVGVVGGVLAIVLAILTLGVFLVVLIPLLIAYAIALIALPIVGAVKAGSGRDYRYPLTPDWVR